MKVRVLRADFATVSPHWSQNHEFAQLYNAASMCPAYLEVYLCKVMIKAKGVLPAHLTQLHEEVATFIAQETQHCKQHVLFNRMLLKNYPDLKPLETKYVADYARLLKTKSLQFNVAYSEGFEAMSAIPTTAFFEDFDELWAQSDPAVEALWKWHLAEEYEHRTVMHNLYIALYGSGPIAYFRRVWGFFYATRHILNFVNSVARVLLAKDREGMSPEELAASKEREKKIQKLAGKHALDHMRRIISPFYDPAKRLPPRGVMEILARDDAPVPIVDHAPASA
jgi:predicted metal-dependent hydrolase